MQRASRGELFQTRLGVFLPITANLLRVAHHQSPSWNGKWRLGRLGSSFDFLLACGGVGHGSARMTGGITLGGKCVLLIFCAHTNDKKTYRRNASHIDTMIRSAHHRKSCFHFHEQSPYPITSHVQPLSLIRVAVPPTRP